MLRGHREDVNCVAFSPDGRRVITGSSEDLGIIWDAATGKRITTTGRHTNNVHSVAFTPDGRRVITGEREELVMMWDAATGAARPDVRRPQRGDPLDRPQPRRADAC